MKVAKSVNMISVQKFSALPIYPV